MKVFKNNPRRNQVSLSDKELENLCKESSERYAELPVYHVGESKEIRQTKVPGLLIQKLIPSLHSYTEKRKGMVEKTDILRLDISSVFMEILHKENIPTCYVARKDEFMIVSEEQIPPVEIIVKGAMIGTPSRIYHGLFSHKDRYGKAFIDNEIHSPYVRFDYRNPLQSENGELLKDECLPIALAQRFIDTKQAEGNALTIFEIIQKTLNKINLQVLDCCLFFDESGTVLCGEISPDNMRIKNIDWNKNKDSANDFDKDLWRKGVDAKLILSQWEILKRKLKENHD